LQPYILISAGEASGDALGVAAIKALQKEISQKWILRGIGGPQMCAMGLRTLLPLERIAVVGIAEVFPRLYMFWRLRKAMMQLLRSPRCKGLICIDYPGLNMGLMKFAKSQGVPILYVAPPQAWAWKQRRAKYFKDVATICLFPFEAEFYKKFGARVYASQPMLLQEAFLQEPTVGTGILLCPGSRMGQIERNAKVLADVSVKLQTGANPHRVYWLAPNAQSAKMLGLFLKSHKFDGEVVWEKSMLNPQLVVTPPGTNSLYWALRGKPVVLFHRPFLLTYILARALLRVQGLSMANLLVQKQIQREVYFFWQARERLLKAVNNALGNGDLFLSLRKELLEIQWGLAPTRAIAQALRKEWL
jgi:lipid-A-disaccharide synthase